MEKMEKKEKKTGSLRYSDPEEYTKKQIEYRKNRYTQIKFELNKESDAKLLDYFANADNKTEALRELFAFYDEGTKTS